MTLRKAFDGEVYYWYEDGKSRQAKSRVTATSVEAGRSVMANEKDKELAHTILMSGSSRYVDPTLEDEIAKALATVRADEREAAFKDMRDLIATVNPKLTFGTANGSVMKQAILQTIDAYIASEVALRRAAENRKGKG